MAYHTAARVAVAVCDLDSDQIRALPAAQLAAEAIERNELAQYGTGPTYLARGS